MAPFIRNTKGITMILLGTIISFLAIQLGIAIEHPDFYPSTNKGKAEWKYVGSHECDSGKQPDGSYAVALNGKVYFIQSQQMVFLNYLHQDVKLTISDKLHYSSNEIVVLQRNIK